MRLIAALLVLLFLAFVPLKRSSSGLHVASKKFTESVILGEMIAQLAEQAGNEAIHYRELGGTKLVFQALRNGDIDIYPEYTGTISEEILDADQEYTADSMREALSELGVVMSAPLGFNNTYAIGMLRSRAEELGISRISDLARHPDLRFGFSNEFIDREDGWRNLKPFYQLPQRQVSGLDHDLAYRQLELGSIDVIDVYSTDAKVEVFDLLVLEDDRDYFPRYDAVLLYRDDLGAQYPDSLASILRLQRAFSEQEMVRLNGRVEAQPSESESKVAADFLRSELGTASTVENSTVTQQVLQRTIEHLELVRRSLIPAILIAIPLGVLAAKRRRFGQLVLAAVGILQTIPALALLVILMPLVSAAGFLSVGLGSATAIAALILYSLLPIVRATHAGLRGIDNEYQEAALALGLPHRFRFFNIELPLASPSILSGIKTAAVMNVGFATLGALIGAGGYGQPILTGIRLNDTSLILQGAIPAAVLAMIVQAGFDLCEQYVVPKGLRLQRE